MNNQNITLSVPKDILQKARILAVKRGTSLSGMLSRYLEEVVLAEEAFVSARRRHLAALEEGPNLGTHGDISWARGDLHER